MLRTTAVLAVAVALVAPAAASAGVAQTRTQADGPSGVPTTHVRYLAAPGERNVLTVESLGPGEWGLRDTGATMTAGRGCVVVNAHAVRCSAITTATGDVEVAAGDRADAVTIAPGLAGRVGGGAGDDVLSGAGRLAGEAGDDELDGRGAAGSGVSLDGGPGDDVLTLDRRPVELACGAGRDRVVADALHAVLLSRARVGDCERIGLGVLTLTTAPRRIGRALTLQASCSMRATPECNGTVTLRARNARGGLTALGRARYTIAAGRRRTLRIALDGADRRLLARAPGARVEVGLRGGTARLAGYPQSVERWLVRPRR